MNKRHLDMVYAHIKYSDKAFMGSVTASERALDTVEMAKILFGAEFVDKDRKSTRLNSSHTDIARMPSSA